MRRDERVAELKEVGERTRGELRVRHPAAPAVWGLAQKKTILVR